MAGLFRIAACLTLLSALQFTSAQTTVIITTTVSGISNTVFACTPVTPSATPLSSSVASSISASTSLSSSIAPSATASASLSAGSSTSNGTASAGSKATVGSTGGIAVDNTILILAPSADDAATAAVGLNGYGIPYQSIVVPSTGITLPSLNSSTSHGNYGGIITVSELAYQYNGVWGSAITDAQWTAIYNYQLAFGVRIVRLNVYPYASAFGANVVGECCNYAVEQLVSFSNTSGFPTANVKTGQGVSTEGLWHYPAQITDHSTTYEIAQFGPSSDGGFTSPSTAAVINDFGGRQQMVFFTSWGSWSVASSYLQHGFIHWMTRGMFVGARKIYLNTQVDDVHLKTALYSPSGTTFRIRPADLDLHVSWQRDLNSRLPAGSSYVMELGHNGNGDITNATLSAGGSSVCNPDTAIYYAVPPATTLEFQKPVGSGSDVWPTTPSSYGWSLACAELDALANWFTNPTNRDAFTHISHTFTHLSLDNATYNDATREISFNIAWLTSVGLAAGKFSGSGLIPSCDYWVSFSAAPIHILHLLIANRMHNGDVIRAWADNGIKQVVGDNSRPPLLNTQNSYWPLISTVANNGYDGMTIVPRWATKIYYDCDLPACTVDEWVNTASGTDTFSALLDYERTTTSHYLLQLRQDPYMFHQANLRAADVPSSTIGPVTGQLSLLQSWVETVTQEMSRITNWPMITLKHDDLALKFTQRAARDACSPNLSYIFSNDGTQITGVTVSANGNSCGVPIPVTLPGAASSSGGSVSSDQVGSEPLIAWVTLSGSPVTITLANPVPV